MPKKKYVVKLNETQRKRLEKCTKSGKISARTINRARVLLLADQGKTDSEIIEVLGVCTKTVHNTRKRFTEEGLEKALNEKPRRGAPPKVDSRLEAHITAIACTDAPEGHATWTMRLIADRLVKLELVDSISHVTVYNVLKKSK